MDQIIISAGLVFVGLCFGSFAGATVWRLRARQLVEDKAAGEDYDKKEYKMLVPLAEQTVSQDRSRCLSCAHQLAWYDLLPLISWVSTEGRCRYCRRPIGLFEPLMEIGVAVFFVLSFMFWPRPLVESLVIIQFILWLIAGVMLAILLAYDLKWKLLPNVVMFPLMVVAALIAQINIAHSSDVQAALLSLDLGIIILSGLYLLLWAISKGRWIGFGDVKLGLVLGLLLGSWELAFFALFAANLLGCLIVIPLLFWRKLTRKSEVPFGPMLIAGFVLSALFGQAIIEWYLSLSSALLF